MNASVQRLRLRLAEVRDVTALRELIEISVRKLSNGYYTAPQIESALLNVLGVDTQLIADQTYFVAETGKSSLWAAAVGASAKRFLAATRQSAR